MREVERKKNFFCDQILSFDTNGLRFIATTPVHDKKRSFSSPISRPSSYTLDPAQSWVLRDGLRLLWLPIDVKPIRFGILGSCVALGTPLGRVTILNLTYE